MREEPNPQPESEPERDPESEPEPDSAPKQGGEQEKLIGRRRPIPPPDPRAVELGKRFMMGGVPALVVTIREGQVADRYAPADLVAKFAAAVAALLQELGGGYQPMLYGVAGRGSMHLVFGDADPLGTQSQLALENTQTQGERVAELIELEGDALFAQAVRTGRPMRRYNELAQLVNSEGVTVDWAVREHETRVLSPERAQSQHARLTQAPRTKDRPMTVNGVLYRVFTESTTREEFRGNVGIHLHRWSLRPPKAAIGARVLAYYEEEAVERKIKEGLVGESVAAHVVIRQPELGWSFEPERFDLVLNDIEAGPREDPLLGPSLLDDDDVAAG